MNFTRLGPPASASPLTCCSAEVVTLFDLLISGGTVFDGTGAAGRQLDIGIRDGVIVATEPSIDGGDTAAVHRLDATGRIVTPGFVDIHTHFDGQVSWDELLDPVTGHGVTTVVMGNCGVGFAPVRPGRQRELIELMEGVEDIPGSALSEGITWSWETFPEYLDMLAARRWSVDVGTQVAHGPLRSYVCVDHPDAATSADDIAEMAAIIRQAIEAGAFGFTTSRTVGHRSAAGDPVPGTAAGEAELQALGQAVAIAGGRVFEVAPSGLFRSDDRQIVAGEVAWMGRLAGATGLASTFILLQSHDAPDRWRVEMDEAAKWRAAGANVVPLVAARSAAVLYGWDIRHPFQARASYRSLAHLPLAERLAALRRPQVRAAILAEPDQATGQTQANELRFLRVILPSCYTLGGDPDYEQPVARRLGALAATTGATVEEVAYDELLTAGSMLRYPLYNYASGDHSVLYEQLSDPATVVSLGDGGAHCAFICDASMPTYLLTHWGRDRTRGPRFPIADLVRRLTSQPADLYGLGDRGRIAVGLRADLNIIDFAALRLSTPVAIHDLPAGGTRLVQPATGYDATIVAGVVTRWHGVDTGARPGRLLRRQ
jgi:N-acyl-D-amino-acid deacylase